MLMQGMKAVNFPDSQYDHHQIGQVAKFDEQSRLEARRTIKARQHSRLTYKHCHIVHICSCMTHQVHWYAQYTSFVERPNASWCVSGVIHSMILSQFCMLCTQSKILNIW